VVFADAVLLGALPDAEVVTLALSTAAAVVAALVSSTDVVEDLELEEPELEEPELEEPELEEPEEAEEPEEPPVKMSFCAPSGKPHLSLYAGLLGSLSASIPSTSMLFPSN